MQTPNNKLDEIDKIVDNNIGIHGIALNQEDTSRLGLYLTATDIGVPKINLREYLSSLLTLTKQEAIETRDKELLEKMRQLSQSEDYRDSFDVQCAFSDFKNFLKALK